MRASRLLVAVGLLLPAGALADRLNIKPGLWETTSTTHTSGVPPLPKAMLDKMTPAQRADMEASMKEAAKGPQTGTERECIAEQDLQNPFESDTEGCTDTIVTSNCAGF